MLTYNLTFALLVLLRFLLVGKPRAAATAYWPVLAFLFLFSAFRFEVGCDWTGYLNQFDLQRESDWTGAFSSGSPLWWTMMEAVHIVRLPYPWVNVVSSLMFFAGIHVLARRQPDRLGFLVLLYPVLIINMPMSGIRQGAAIGLLAVAFVAFADRRLWRYLAFTAAAAAVHASAALFFLLAPFVSGRRLNLPRLMLAAAIAAPAGLLLLGAEFTTEAVDRYVDTGIEAAGGIFRTGLLSITGLFFLAAMRRGWQARFPADYRLAFIGSWLMLLVTPLVFVSSVIADRASYYLIPLQAMVLARIPAAMHSRLMPVFAIAPYLGLGVVLWYWTANSIMFQICYDPYQSWIAGFPENITYPF